MTGVPPLDPELAEFVTRFEEAKSRAVALTRGLSADELRWQPAPDRWSIEDCLRHLNITGYHYLPRLDHALERTRAAGHFGEGASRRPRIGEWLIRSLEPPPQRRFKVPGVFRSHPRAEGEAPLAGFLALQDDLIRRVHDAAGLDISRVMIRSPAMPLIRFTIAQVFALTATHQRRHLWQAEQVRVEAPRHA